MELVSEYKNLLHTKKAGELPAFKFISVCPTGFEPVALSLEG